MPTWHYGPLAFEGQQNNQQLLPNKAKVCWSLKHALKGSNEPQFHLSIKIKERKLRLIAKNPTTITSSELSVTTKNKDSFSNPQKSQWTIEAI